MWVPQDVQESDAAGEGPAGPPSSTGGPPRRGRQRRRGVTSMEYVVMASFILMILIGSVQYFGYSVGNLFTYDAAATTKVDTASHNPP